MIQVSALAKSYPGKVLFEDVTFTMTEKERLGLVGRNGSGKSTLAKIILGLEEPDSGEVARPKGYKLGYLDQHISFSEKSLIEECAKYLPKDQIYDYYRAEKILFGLGFEKGDLEKDPHQFSGGYQLRINLTKCLLQEPNLLVLDEPTNYLDLPSMYWMRDFLRAYDGEVIIISHDKQFMNSIISHTAGIHRGKLKKVEGKTEKYYEQIKLEEEIYEKTRRNQEKKKEQMQSFVDRFRAQATKAKQAQSIMKRLNKMENMSELDLEQAIGFQFQYEELPAKKLLEVSGLSFGFAEGNPLFSDLNFTIQNSDKVAIIGKNGKGKTTLLNVLAGQLKPNTGEVIYHPKLDIAYYQQTNRKDLDPNKTIEEEVWSANEQLDYSKVRAVCGAMMFSGGDAKKKIKVLSGGEQSRVLLAKILTKKCNMLLLDEPTNHLDMESIEILSDEMEGFDGPIMFVSHDENMLRRLANKFIVFHQGRAQWFEGTYDDFLKKIGWQEEDKKQKKAVRQHKKDLANKKREEKEIAKQKKELEMLEAEIQHLENLISEKTDLATKEPEKNDLFQEIASLQEKLDNKIEDWQDLGSKNFD